MDVCLTVGLAVSFYLLGYVGDYLSSLPGTVGVLWPPTGLALGALLLYGGDLWPGITVGDLMVNLLVWGRPPLVALAVAAGATVGVACGYLLLQRVGFRAQMDRVRDLIALIGLGAVVGMTITATVRVGTLFVAGRVKPGDLWTTWLLDWISAVMGVIIVTPVVLLLPRIRLRPVQRPRRVVEAVALFATAFAVMAVVTHSFAQLQFLIFPVLIWAALRFHLPGAAPCVLLVSLIAAYGAVVGSGPYEGQNLTSKLITIHSFDAAAALVALVLAVVTVERNSAHADVEESAAALATTVVKLSQKLRRPYPRPDNRHPIDKLHGEQLVTTERISPTDGHRPPKNAAD